MRELRIVTIGGGSSYTPEIIEGFIARKLSGALPIKDIYLVDVPEGQEKLNIVGSLAKRMVEKAGADINIHLTCDRREALKGADFVTTQFRVGQLAARINDEKIPLKYGMIGQETNGAGGFAKALRTIPVIMDICRDIEELCPNAWLINFTNPSGMVTEAVLKYFPNVKVLGLCNVPISTVDMIAKLYDVDRSRIYVEFAGLNHFIWGRRVFKDGVDVTREVLAMMKDGEAFTMRNIPRTEWCEELLTAIDMLPCPYHRYYYQKDDALKHCQEEAQDKGTRGEVVKALEDELFELYKDKDLAVKPEQLAKRGGALYSEAAVNLIESLYNDRKDIQYVNVRNNGALSDLPENAAVECCAVIGSNGAMPLAVGHLPPGQRGMLQLQKAFEELTVEAAVTGNYSTALHALTINPLVWDAVKAKSVLDDLLEVNKKYLPQFNR